MAIWVNDDTRLVVQGITGKEGKFHALGCRDYGTKVVAGVTPGKGGESVEGIPVYDTVAEAREKQGANATMIFVPPPYAADAVMEGWRVTRLVTHVARVTRDVAAAASVMATHGSSALPGVSAMPTRSKPRSSPRRAMRAVYSGV